MTREERKLLLKDLCARLPYYTELYSSVADHNRAILTTVVIYNLMNATDTLVIKPYLRPMSSMTEEEKLDYIALGDIKRYINPQYAYLISEQLDYLNAHHFDYRGLIEKGLALEAPEGMYKF